MQVHYVELAVYAVNQSLNSLLPLFVSSHIILHINVNNAINQMQPF